jgi:hypothetical protein
MFDRPTVSGHGRTQFPRCESQQRWQLLQMLTQHFWQRWSSDYLTSLQKRSKTGGITKPNMTCHPEGR